MPREPACAAERRQDAESEGGIERAKNRMFVASVRRRGMGSPDPPRSHARARIGSAGGKTLPRQTVVA
jgi:hypothetical protein